MANYNNKPNIAFIISSLNPGGAERVLSILANQFTENYNVLIIFLNKDKLFYKLNKQVKIVYCNQKEIISKSYFEAVKNNFKLVKKINYFLKTEKINLIIGFTTASNVLSVIAGTFLKIPIIISERNNPYNIKVNLFWKTLRKLVYFKTSCLVLQTNYVKKYYKYFVPKKKIHVLPNPISSLLVRERLLNQKRKNIILNVGSFIDRKNQEMLIKSFAHINNYNWELHLAGDGKNRERYEKLISKIRIKDKIKLLGNCKEIYKQYNSSKIFAFTSKSEGFPNVLIEAMYFGLACVSVDCPAGPSELIRDEENGFLVPCDNQKIFEMRLKKLMETESLINKFSQQAVRSTINFETKQVCNLWENLIKSTLN